MLLNVGSGGGAAAAPATGGAAAATGGAGDAPAEKEEEKEEGMMALHCHMWHFANISIEKEESDEDMGFGLFD